MSIKTDDCAKIVITTMSIREKTHTLCCLMQGNRLAQVQVEHTSFLGNIYIGKVQRIVKNLNAAFVEITPGEVCYLPLDQLKNPIYVKKTSPHPLVQGDELIVQVTKEAIKTKAPLVSTNLNLTGRYVALTTESKKLGISKKLDAALRGRFKELLMPYVDETFGIVVRTNAQHADAEAVLSELFQLRETLFNIRAHAGMRTCFSCLYRAAASSISFVQNAAREGLLEIVTDQKDIFDELTGYCRQQSDLASVSLRLYEDASYPLASLYNLSTQIERALQKTVWLKSGAFLVIEPTEALTVIDVNTGKSMAKADVQDHFARVNREASEEIARQLRLRNISGIVIIDYIDLESDEEREALLKHLIEQVKADPIQVTIHGMTQLNLVELTRKKVEKSLLEQLS